MLAQTTGLTKLIMSSHLPDALGGGMHFMEDPRAMQKSASTIFGCEYDDVKPDKDHVGIHVVGLGAWEWYGANRNADSFPKEACEKFHDTFVKHGHVFRNHVNKDPAGALGTIVKSAFNPAMGRIELFLHAHKDKARDELQKLARDGEHGFSMACVRGDSLIGTIDGQRCIDAIQPQQSVLTHAANWKPAGNRSVRTVDEYLRVEFVSWGGTELDITANHEVLAVRFEDIPSIRPTGATGRRLSSYRQVHRSRLHQFKQWIPAGQLTDLHYMLVPIDRIEDQRVDLDWARVLGYYIAEGSFGSGVTQFTCRHDDAAVSELGVLADWTSVSITPKANSDLAVTVNCFGTELARQIDDECGHPGPNKRVPMLIQHADADAKLHFLAAWFNGDGWQDDDGLHWSTHYKGLAIDLQRLLASLDIRSSCSRIMHPFDRGVVRSADAVEYVVTVSNEFSELFAGISKAGVRTIDGGTKCRTFISGDYLCVPVRSVTVMREALEVHNFSVADDESYTVYGLAVHNCRVPHDRCSRCNTLRKSASDLNQCDHIRYELRKVARDGTVTCTHNDLPTFFDMSFVGRPADRIAWDLKVASWDALDSCKLAADEGIWVPESVLATERPIAQKLLLFDKLAAAERHLYELAVKAPATVSERYTWELCKAADYDLSDAAIETMRREDPATMLTKLAQAGVVLSPSAFFKYAFGTTNNPLAAEMPEILAFIKAGVFSQLSKEARQAACINSYFDIDSNTQGAYILSRDPDLETLASSLKKDASFADPAVRQRVIDQTVAGRAVKIPSVMSGQTKVALSHSDTVEKSAHVYAAYKLSAVSAINALSLVDQNSLTTLAAAQNLLTQPE